MSNHTEDQSRWWKASDGSWYPLGWYPAAPQEAPGSTPSMTMPAVAAAQESGDHDESDSAPLRSRRRSAVSRSDSSRSV